jgi:hypothetical protein
VCEHMSHEHVCTSMDMYVVHMHSRMCRYFCFCFSIQSIIPLGILRVDQSGTYQVTLPRRWQADTEPRDAGELVEQHLWELRYLYKRLTDAGAFAGKERLHCVVHRWLDHTKYVWLLGFGHSSLPRLQMTRNATLYHIKQKQKASREELVVNADEQSKYLESLLQEIEVPTQLIFGMVLCRALPAFVGKPVQDNFRRPAAHWMRRFIDDCCIESDMRRVQFQCPGADVQERLGTA